MATRSLGQLTLDLVARIGGFTGPLEKAKRTAKSDMSDIAKSAKVASTAVLAIAGSAAATGTAVVAFTKHAADSARELKNQASLANASTTEIQRWGYASQQVGIEQDKLADILKDVNDRVGDFMATGGGPMADFFENIAPQVGVTAEQFRYLSGPQALQLYYDSLQKANLSQQDMTFYLEALASDTTALIPLLRDGGKSIASMGDEAERLGLVLSDMDIAQLEEFARQFDRISGQISTIGNMLAADLAPYLTVIGDRIQDVSKNSEELGLIFPTAIRDSIEATGWLLDALHLLNVPLQGLQAFAGTIAQAYTTAFATITEAATNSLDFIAGGLNELIAGFNHLPGVDVPLIGSFNNSPYMQSVRAMAKEVAERAEKQRQDFVDAVTDPLPSTAIDEYLADVDAKLAAFRAEHDGVELKPLDDWLFKPPSKVTGGTGAGSNTDDPTKAIRDQIASLKQQAEMVGLNTDQQTLFKLAAEGATEAQLAQARAALETVAAYDDQQQALEDYRSLVDELRTPEEKLNDTLLKRLDILEAAKVSQDEYADAVARIADAGFTDAPEYEGLDASIGGAFGELGKIDEAQAELEDWYATQLEMLDTYRSERADLTEQWDAQERDLKQEHEDELASIEQARQVAQLAAAESVFGDLAGLSAAFVGEQSSAYRALFAVSKAAAVAQALMNVPSSFSKAFDAVVGIPYVGPVLAPAAGAAAAAAQVAQATQLQNIGMAHDGIDSVPADGSWFLQKGERVTTSETSAKLDRTLDSVQSGMTQSGSDGGNVVVNLNEDASRAGQSNRRQDNGTTVLDIWVARIRQGGNDEADALEQTYGLKRGR
ncbi:phage tail tape measure protein [Salinicola sp. CPA57]|uniref:phage tail tape measure protein n=1 Tax=Salinicola sp. CPA57 TaxID=1949080 RepID=UPI000DA25213|nr:phage tail tape measure protein [Salinicola sp. CPA57]